MGINNLNKFLRNNCKHIYEEIHLSEFAFKKVAIDISLYLCKYKIVCEDRWLSAFINLVSCLRKNNIHCVFIYDNGAPPEKEKEKEARANHRDKLDQEVYDLQMALESYYETDIVNKTLLDLDAKIKKKNKTKNGSLFGNRKNDNVDISAIESYIKKKDSQILKINPGDFELTKSLFKLLNVPCYDAMLEAETTCADLCKRGIVDAVLSEDTDVLAYGCPVFLSKINTANSTCVKICHEEMLDSLELDEKRFLDLCIMCGTDYNKNIFRVGPEKSYKLIQKHGDIDKIKESGVDVSILNHERVRQLFTEYARFPEIDIPYCGRPFYDELYKFVQENKIYNINIENIKKNFEPQFVIFEESDIEKVESEESSEIELVIES